MSTFKRIWTRLSRNGLNEQEGVFGHREVIFLNKILCVGPLIILLIIPIEITVNGFRLVPLELIFMAMMIFCFFLQTYRFFWLAKFMAIFLGHLFIVVAGVMVGKGVANQIALIPISLFGMLLFKQSRNKLLVLTLTVFSYFLLLYLRDTVEPTHHLGDESKQFFTHVFYMMTLILTFFLGYYFLGINEQYEHLIVEQKEVLAERNREVTDSIRYAKRIQQCLLAHDAYLEQHLPSHFIVYKPKDIVSGDFYWAGRINDKNRDLFYLAVCDSTGHGVPGAFMSLLNITFLNEAITEKTITQPNLVFNLVRARLTESISKDGQKDGFDGILLCIDRNTKTMTYAAANNAPVIIRNKQCHELAADRMPVGVGERKEEFKQYTITCEPGDMLYLYTDGFADQFGGPKGKKFKYSQLNTLLAENSGKDLKVQRERLNQAFEDWRGTLEQVDDVCLVGIKL